MNYLLPRLRPFAMSSLQPVVISGPSGSGKSTLLKLLFQEYPGAFGFSVSHTTRKQRNGEIDGKDYYFTNEEQMMKEVEEGKFIEYTKFSGNYYGTSKFAVKQVLDSQRICILDIDEEGVRSMHNTNMNALYIFVKPPSLEELSRRLKSRGTETDESLKMRMETATSSLEFSKQAGIYDFVLENSDLETAYGKLREFLKQKCPVILKKHDSALETPLTNISKISLMSQQIEARDSVSNIKIDGTETPLENSVAEIPLSPSRPSPENDVPAVVNVGETPLLLVNQLQEEAEVHRNSAAVVELEESDEAISSNSGVCGRHDWCSVL